MAMKARTLLLSCLLCATAASSIAPVPARGAVATEWTQVMNNYQLVMSYYRQLQQYRVQLDQYKQQLVRGRIFRQKALAIADFKKRPLDDGVLERCPSGLKSLLSNPAVEDRCIFLVRTENARYNAVVDVLNTARERDRELAEIYEERAKIPEANTGELLANTNRLDAFLARLSSDMQRARTQTETYDTLIGLIRQEQAMAARQTLDGDVSGAVRGLALHVALKKARRSDR